MIEDDKSPVSADDAADEQLEQTAEEVEPTVEAPEPAPEVEPEVEPAAEVGDVAEVESANEAGDAPEVEPAPASEVRPESAPVGEPAPAAEAVTEPVERRSWFARFGRKPKAAVTPAPPVVESSPAPDEPLASILPLPAAELPVRRQDDTIAPLWSDEVAPQTMGLGTTLPSESELTGVLEVLRERSATMRDAESETGPEGTADGEVLPVPDAASDASESDSAADEVAPVVEAEPAADDVAPVAESTSETGADSADAAEADGIFAWLGMAEDDTTEAAVSDDQRSLFGGALLSGQLPSVPAETQAASAAESAMTQLLPAVASDAPAAPDGVDMGPARQRRWWIWALVAVAVLAVAGAVGYAWWWTTSRPIIVPDIVGKKPAEATQVLNDLELALGKVSELPTDSAPAGTIISQKPKAKTTLKPGQTVAFVVAASPELAKIPSVVGVSQDDAAKLLAEARLRPKVVESYNATVPAGFVISQLPTVGVELPPGSMVVLATSKGLAPGATTVPHVNALPEADAVTLLQARGLVVHVYRSRDASITAGQVMAQSPLPGSSAAPGGAAQILVSSGPAAAAATVPTVVSGTRKAAEASLKARNLTADIVVVPNATVPKGNVISQMPMGGTRVGSGAVVGLLVSSGPETPGVVPSLVGTLSADASTTVTASGFKAVVIGLPVAGQTEGRVFAQYPAPGTSYTRGFPVICLVAEALKL